MSSPGLTRRDTLRGVGALGYAPTGKPETMLAFTSDNPYLIDCAQKGIVAYDLQRTKVLKPILNSFFFGVGGFLNLVGVPTIGLLSGPNYLMSWNTDDGHLGKLDPALMYKQVNGCADILARLDATPMANLHLGGTQLLGDGKLPPIVEGQWFAWSLAIMQWFGTIGT
jgi:hypothetical protein